MKYDWLEGFDAIFISILNLYSPDSSHVGQKSNAPGKSV